MERMESCGKGSLDMALVSWRKERRGTQHGKYVWKVQTYITKI